MKVSTEVKDAINQLGSDLGGLTQKEVLELLLSLYRAKQEEDQGTAIPNLENLHYHFTRIEGIYTEFVRSARDKNEQNATEIARLDVTLQESQIRQLELTTALDQAQKTATSEAESYRAEAALAKEDAAKEIAHIQSLLEEAQASREQSAQLVQLAQHAADEAVRRAEQYEELAGKTETFQNERNEAMSQVGELQRELERTRERTAIEQERAVLDTERKYLELVDGLRNALAESRDAMADLRVKLAEMEKVKTPARNRQREKQKPPQNS